MGRRELRCLAGAAVIVTGGGHRNGEACAVRVAEEDAYSGGRLGVVRCCRAAIPHLRRSTKSPAIGHDPLRIRS
jgi:hypothetical protein